MFKVIRDFIYVDVDRLKSLYSQVFEGIAERIIDSYTETSSSEDKQKGNILSGKEILEQVSESANRLEDKILFDHLYNKLESEIENLLVDTSQITNDDYDENLKDAFLIKVKGGAEINDYKRLSDYTSKFNSIAEAIAYAGHFTDLKEMEKQLELIKNKEEKNKFQQQFKHRASPQKLAQEMGLYQDPKLLENIKMFTDFFYPEGFEITITPAKQKNIAYRGVLDKTYLRKNPEYLRTHYGGIVNSEWIMVGEITYIPKKDGTARENEHELITIEQDEVNPSMRDPFRNIFAASRIFEKMFFISKSRIEIIVSPLAIYRETKYESMQI